jgi:hypothetical protein
MLANHTTSENWKNISGLFCDILPKKEFSVFKKNRKWSDFVGF